MIDTSGTCHNYSKAGHDIWIFNGWKKFLGSEGLTEFDHFLQLTGQQMDRNRRSVVYRIELGSDKQIFYIKIHRDYYKQSVSTFFRKVPYAEIELNCLMHYERAGLNKLEPVAWGWRPEGGNVGFLLLKELSGYISLQDWLNSDDSLKPDQRELVSKAVASMLATMHRYGLAHIDLFSWHVFIKKNEDKFDAHPIDLERTKNKGCWPWSKWFARLKQANDLAVLHLTVPWPQVSFAQRMRFYHEYCNLVGLKDKNHFFLKFILKTAKHRGRKRKFKKYGVAPLL